jgi:hypothetical protein
MITELLPALQATPPHPLLAVEDPGWDPGLGVRHLDLIWADTPPGRLCRCLDHAQRLFGDGGSAERDQGVRYQRRARALVRTLTPDELLTVQLHAPAAVREFVLLNLGTA